MIPVSLNQLSVCLVNTVFSIIKHENVCMEINNNIESKVSANQNKDISLQSKVSKSRTTYLSIETVQKMICRFLTEKQISKQKLAGYLRISVKSLLQLCSSQIPSELIPRINLRLIKLYCRTNFNNQEEKKDAINKFKKYVQSRN